MPKGTSWRNPANQQKIPFTPRRYNTGVPCGLRNNLLVVDLDVNVDGVTEFGKHIAAHGEPQTLEVRTPTKGYHYYLNYSNEDADCQQMIKNHLRNASKFRGKGIDIRIEGGYIVAPPSERIEGEYEVMVNRKPVDIPGSLINWLFEGYSSVASDPAKPHHKCEAKKLAEVCGVSASYDIAAIP